MKVEHITWVRFASWWAAKEERHLTIRDGLLAEIVIDAQRVSAGVAEVLAHRHTRVGREELQGRDLGRRRHDDDRVLHRSDLVAGGMVAVLFWIPSIFIHDLSRTFPWPLIWGSVGSGAFLLYRYLDRTLPK